jgi:hypothetical protein
MNLSVQRTPAITEKPCCKRLPHFPERTGSHARVNVTSA